MDRATTAVAQHPRTGEETSASVGDLRSVLSSIGEAIYTWDLASDGLVWSGNAASLLRTGETGAIACGRAYARIVVPDAGVSRYDAVMRATQCDAGHGVPFQTCYAIAPDAGGAPLWIQDTGRWFAGAEGRATRVHGVVRVLPEAPAPAASGGESADELTGGLTRAQFGDLLEDEIVQARRQQRSFAVVLVGIEGLGQINEAFGLDVADELIGGAAKRLRSVMRRGDSLARYSGNKLAIVLMGCAEEQLPVAAARFLDAARATPVDTSAGPMPCAIRIGGVQLPRFGQTAAQAMQHAEEALQDAKHSPNRCFVAFAPDRRRDERRQSNRRFTDEIVASLNDRRVAMVLQPIVDARTREVAYHEALVRILARDGTVLPASEVIPVAEKLGIVPLIDHRMLEMAVAEMTAAPAARLSINVSSATLRQPDWVEALSGHLGRRPGVAQRLVVELTETCAIDDIEATGRSIAAMRDLGVKVAIDDFGSGHTSFRHLRELSVDLIKIDGVFVQNLGRSTDDRFFVRTLLDLARNLNVPTVAEWVQDEETARLLQGWGVDYLQGELFGQPVLPMVGSLKPLASAML